MKSKNSARNYDILEKALGGTSLSDAPSQRASGDTDQARNDFVRYLEGDSAWDERFAQFMPKARGS